MEKEKPLALVILGPTASGKSDLAVRFAKALDGEIVSADSRQVYRGLDLASGKITAEEMAGVPHHLLDVANLNERFSVAAYQKSALEQIAAISKRGKLPILCGGTGYYIQAVVDGLVLPEVLPNLALRQKLENQTTEELFKQLEELDPERAAAIERQNRRRLIRALEIATALGHVPPLGHSLGSLASKWEFIQLGVRRPAAELRARIAARLRARLGRGLIQEIALLHQQGASWQRLEELGLECRFIAQHLQGKLTRTEMARQLELAIWHYARRQLTWFRRDRRIYWLSTADLTRLGADGASAVEFRAVLEGAPSLVQRQDGMEEA